MAEQNANKRAQLALDSANAVAVLTLSGEWTVHHLPEEERVVFSSLAGRYSSLIVNGATLGEVDTSGAWLIVKAVRTLGVDVAAIEWAGFSDSHIKLLSLVMGMSYEPGNVRTGSFVYRSVVGLGQYCVETAGGSMKLTSFFGQLCGTVVRTFLHPRRLRFKSVIHHANEVGIKAMPIVIMMAFFISLVLGYQGANQLRQFGAKEYTVNLVGISMLREMGVLITAILAAGRTCSAFAAQLGVMRMNEEVAAMRTLGLDPFELLVLPRILGTIIALPVLTFVADLSGLLGTYFVASAYLGLSYMQFVQRLMQAVTEMTFYIGLMKAPVFAFFVGMIGCYQGLQVRTSATELGLRTTTAVVQAIFWIVLMDAVFSVIFTMLNI